VGEFSRLTPKETLHKTLQAVRIIKGDPTTFHDVQVQLSDVESNRNQRAAELHTKQVNVITWARLRRNQVFLQATRDILKVQLDNMQLEVERMDNRKQAIENLDRCTAKLAVCEYDTCEQHAVECRQGVEAADNAFSEAKNVIAPLGKSP
jgi:hypothetical protein